MKLSMNRRILRWELIGIPVISVAGALLHFVFEWSGYWSPVGAIAAVNESVWEHFKIGFWPTLLYAIVEFIIMGKSLKNFAFAKAIGIYAIPATIAIIFYSYTAIIGHEILAVDILSFVVAIAIGQIVSYKLLTSRQLPAWSHTLGIILVVALAIAFVIFSYYPPHLPIFQDSPTGNYGIL
jgi:hypothetical protein